MVYNRPEKRSFNFEWDSFVHVINTELIGNIVNLVHRICSLIWNYNSGNIYSPLPINNSYNINFITEVQQYVDSIISNIETIQIKDTLRDIVNLSKSINGHLSKQEPWKNNNEQERSEDIYFVYLLAILVVYLLFPVIPDIGLGLKHQLGAELIRLDLPSERIQNWIINFNTSQKLPVLKKVIAPLEVKDLIGKYETLKKT